MGSVLRSMMARRRPLSRSGPARSSPTPPARAPNRCRRDRQRQRDLVVAAAFELALDERLALSLGQRLDVVDDARELLAPRGDLGRLRHPVVVLVEALVSGLVPAVVEGAVADD